MVNEATFQEILLPSLDLMKLEQSNETTWVFQNWNQQATFCPSPQCLIDQIKGQKPILVVATDKMPDHTLSRE